MTRSSKDYSAPHRLTAGDDVKPKRGPTGDVIVDADAPDPRATGSTRQETVEDRGNVGMVKPEDYPEADRKIATSSNPPGKG